MTDDTTTATAPSPKRRSHIDPATMTITITQKDSEPKTFGIGSLPFQVRDYLTLRGAQAELMAADDVGAAYLDFAGGKIPESKAPAAPKLPKAREAIAHALAHAKAKAEAMPGTKAAAIKAEAERLLPGMTKVALEMTKEKVTKLSKTADVEENYHRLFGVKHTGVSLLELAGLSDPPVEDVKMDEAAD